MSLYIIAAATLGVIGVFLAGAGIGAGRERLRHQREQEDARISAPLADEHADLTGAPVQLIAQPRLPTPGYLPRHAIHAEYGETTDTFMRIVDVSYGSTT